MIKLGVLISGSGTNLQAILNAINGGSLNAQVALVISSKADALGLKRAHEAGVATVGLTPQVYADPLAADALITQQLLDAAVDYVVMAGYMRKVGPLLLGAFANRVINIHPALLPAFPGAHGIADAFNAGVKVTGVTVHFANEAYDRGPIIAQQALPILEQDTLESLEERIHAIEHTLYPQTLELIAQGRVSITAHNKVHIA